MFVHYTISGIRYTHFHRTLEQSHNSDKLLIQQSCIGDKGNVMFFVTTPVILHIPTVLTQSHGGMVNIMDEQR